MFSFQRLLFRRSGQASQALNRLPDGPNEEPSELDHQAVSTPVSLRRSTITNLSKLGRINRKDSQTLDQKLDSGLQKAKHYLIEQQQDDGHWCFELEADCTISAEYIMMMHWLGHEALDRKLEQRLARYLCSHQKSHGGWELYPGGGFHISVSVKVYYALKLAGYSEEQPLMQHARQAILAAGGAARSNVFTRILLAQFGQVPWRAIPVIPAEIVLLPGWFFFSLKRVAYWSRAVMVPLTIQYSLRARAKNPDGVSIRELFTVDPEQEQDYFPVRSTLNRVFLGLERLGRLIEPFIPRRIRKQALVRAELWMLERLNGEHGLGAIFPAMTNSLQALHTLGYPLHHPLCQQIQRALQALLVEREEDQTYCQPCLSPVWDTAWCCVALREVDQGSLSQSQLAGLDWLKHRQITDHHGDWQSSQPDLPAGGWAFQYQNAHYPDLDDTAVVAWAMQLIAPMRYRDNIQRATCWLNGMQSANGGFAAFDQDNTSYYLNEIPFADHGALLDPPTADVTARCLMHLASQDPFSDTCQRALKYLAQQQEVSGAWFGRWGTNYIYGTWSVLQALEYWISYASQIKNPDPARFPDVAAMQARAAVWLHSKQRDDGGWGESNDSYYSAKHAGVGQRSMSVQTAWALLGLMAAGESDSPSLRAGIAWLLREQQASGRWHDPEFNAPGFPRVFHLNYHGYGCFFPLWALARYRNLNRSR